jgi:hypothetical protein
MPPISMVLFALIVAVVAYFAIASSDQPTDEQLDPAGVARPGPGHRSASSLPH